MPKPKGFNQSTESAQPPKSQDLNINRSSPPEHKDELTPLGDITGQPNEPKKEKSQKPKNNKDKKKKNKTKKNEGKDIKIKSFTIGFTVVFAALLVSGTLISALQKDTMVWGMDLGQAQIGGLTVAEAQEHVERDYAQTISEKVITLTYQEDISYSVSASELGITLDTEKSIDKAYEIGHSQSFFQQLLDRINIFGNRDSILIIDIDDEIFGNKLSELFGIAETPKLEPKLVWNEYKVEIDAGQDGSSINKDEIKKEILRNIESPSIKVSLQVDIVPISSNINKIDNIRRSIQEFMDKPLILTAQEQRWEIDQNQKKEWISPKYLSGESSYKLNDEKIKLYLEEINKGFVTGSRNPFVTRNSDGSLTLIKPHKDGREISIDGSLNILLAQILGRQEITLDIADVPPLIDSDVVNTTRLPDLLGTSSTHFGGSSYSRVNNIQRGMDQVNGYILAAGESFSFIDLVKVTYDLGFMDAPVIVSGKVRPGLGGGICQVSSTLFQSILPAGLKVTERWPHAFVISKYGAGYDATIARPVKDLKFENNTGNPIQITSYFNGSTIHFEIWGINDGREVKVIGPSVYYRGSNGSSKAKVTQEIYRNGQLESNETFKSSYASQSSYR